MRGLSVDEILPAMIDTYEMRVRSQSGWKSLRADDLAEQFPAFYLLDAAEGWSLEVRGEIFPLVDTIEILGDRVDSPSMEVWVSWEGVPELKAEIERYAELHDVSIRTQEVPRIDTKLISVLRGGGTLPDVFMVQSSDIPNLTQARALQNLDYLSTVRLDEKGVEAFRSDDKTWALPLYFDAQVLFYNRALVAGVISLNQAQKLDWTLSDFERICKLLIERDIAPITWNVFSAYWLIPFQIGFGKDALIDDDDGITIDDQATHDALEYLLSLRERGFLTEMERDGMIALFVSGRIAMILSGSYSIPQFTELGLFFGVLPYPVNQETGKPLSPLLDYKGLAISRTTKNPILARRLIQYLTGIGVQQRFPSALSKLPANSQVWRIVETENEYSRVLFRSWEIGTVVPPARSYPAFKNTMWKLLRFIFTGQMSVTDTLKTGQEIIDRQLGRR